MIISGRRFSASWWSVALTVTGMSLFIVLGLWQLERAVLKESIESKFEQRLTEPYLIVSPGDDLKDIEYRKVLVEGSFDNARNFLVDNQLHRGRAGYHVVTPLRLKDSDKVLLVNRGWAPWGESRDEPALILEPASSFSRIHFPRRTGSVSVFCESPPDQHLLRFCFAKDSNTLQRATEILCRI